MKVFIAGGSGFINKAVLKNLFARNHEVTTLLLICEPEETVRGVRFVLGAARADRYPKKQKVLSKSSWVMIG